MNGALVVTLHDVTPRTLPLCRLAVEAVAAVGLSRLGLLVIPADPAGPLRPDDPTAVWLRQLAGQGHEVIQHGYLHRRLPAARLPLREAIANRLLARGAAEFVALGADDALSRLDAGRASLLAAGLRAEGFIAPAWLHSSGTRHALRQAGFRYFASHLALHDVALDRHHRSATLCNRPCSRFSDWTARRVNELLLLVQSRSPLIRVALHPADLLGGRSFRHTLALIEGLLEQRREPLTYGQYLNRAS